MLSKENFRMDGSAKHAQKIVGQGQLMEGERKLSVRDSESGLGRYFSRAS